MLTSTLVSLLVVLIILGAVLYVVGLLPIDATVKAIIRVVALVLLALWLLGLVSGHSLIR